MPLGAANLAEGMMAGQKEEDGFSGFGSRTGCVGYVI